MRQDIDTIGHTLKILPVLLGAKGSSQATHKHSSFTLNETMSMAAGIQRGITMCVYPELLLWPSLQASSLLSLLMAMGISCLTSSSMPSEPAPV